MRKECYEITLFSTLHMKKVKAKPSLGQKWLVKLMLLYINTVSGSDHEVTSSIGIMLKLKGQAGPSSTKIHYI